VSVNGLPREILDGGLVVAIDLGKVMHRVWVTDRGGVVGEPVSLPSSRAGFDRLQVLVGTAPATFAVEATGALHRAWAAELETAVAGVAAGVRAVADGRGARAVGDAAV
jgi:hypothetical protein